MKRLKSNACTVTHFARLAPSSLSLALYLLIQSFFSQPKLWHIRESCELSYMRSFAALRKSKHTHTHTERERWREPVWEVAHAPCGLLLPRWLIRISKHTKKISYIPIAVNKRAEHPQLGKHWRAAIRAKQTTARQVTADPMELKLEPKSNLLERYVDIGCVSYLCAYLPFETLVDASIADCHWFMPLIVIHHAVGGPAITSCGPHRCLAPVPASSPSLRSNSALDIACSRHINQPKIEIKSNQTKVVCMANKNVFGPKQRLMICLCPGNGLPQLVVGAVPHLVVRFISRSHFYGRLRKLCVVASDLSHVSINLA